MISKALELFSKSVGMNTAEDCIYGIYGGFFITISEKKTRKIVEISCYIGDSDEYSDDYVSINDAIRSVIDKYMITDYAVDEDYVAVTSHAELSQFRELVDYLTGMLDDLDIYNSDYCSKCGEKFADDSARRIVTETHGKNSHKHLVCDSCALEYAEKDRSTAASAEPAAVRIFPALAASFFAGLAAAVLYALVFLIAGANGRGTMIRFAPCLAALLIGAADILVYKLKAKAFTVKGVIGLSIVTGICTLIAHLLGCTFGYIKLVKDTITASGIPFSFSFTVFKNALISQFTDTKNLSFLIIGAVIALCCAYIAVIFIYGLDYKKKEELKKIRVSIQRVK